MNSFYNKKNLYVIGVVISVFMISSVFIFKELKAQNNNDSIEVTEVKLFNILKDYIYEYGNKDNADIENFQDNIIDHNPMEIANTYISSQIENKETSQKNLSPIKEERYIVNRGDTLFLIARRANLSLDELKTINNIQQEDSIYEGQVLQTKKTSTAPISTTPNPIKTEGDSIYWLSRIIHAEAQGEPYEGKVAVGNVVLNRVAHWDFPNTIYEVIYDRQHGYVQFSPVLDGNINNTPNEESKKAAIDALNGAKPVGDALYFLNPRKATNFWIVNNREYFMTIGEHDYYY